MIGKYNAYYLEISECSTSKETQKLDKAGSSQDEQATGGGPVIQEASQSKQGDFNYDISNFFLLFKAISHCILSSLIPTDKEYLLLDEENLTPAEMRHISWTQYWDKEDRTYAEIK